MRRCTSSRLSQCTAWNVSSLVLCFLSLDIFYSGACSYGKGQLHVMRDALNLSLLPYQRRPVELQLIGVGLSPVLRFVISSSNGACAQPSSPHVSRARLTSPAHCCCPAVTCRLPCSIPHSAEIGTATSALDATPELRSQISAWSESTPDLSTLSLRIEPCTPTSSRTTPYRVSSSPLLLGAQSPPARPRPLRARLP